MSDRPEPERLHTLRNPTGLQHREVSGELTHNSSRFMDCDGWHYGTNVAVSDGGEDTE